MLFLQGSAGTRNKCGGQYLYHCVKNILGCNLSKIDENWSTFNKVISIYHDTSNTVQFFGATLNPSCDAVAVVPPHSPGGVVRSAEMAAGSKALSGCTAPAVAMAYPERVRVFKLPH